MPIRRVVLNLWILGILWPMQWNGGNSSSRDSAAPEVRRGGATGRPKPGSPLHFTHKDPAIMRVLSATVWTWLLICIAGCQATSYRYAPIVGDSMTVARHGYRTYGPSGMDEFSDCSPGAMGCTAESMPGCNINAGGMIMDGAMQGCAGHGCDGRCGGRCAVALARMKAGLWRLEDQARCFVASRPCVAQAVAHAQQRCAGGACQGPPGPEFGAVMYPYYTTRGPRDFLMANPPPLGP